jgi:thiol-disulfide isomerase/thioredoxin
MLLYTHCRFAFLLAQNHEDAVAQNQLAENINTRLYSNVDQQRGTQYLDHAPTGIAVANQQQTHIVQQPQAITAQHQHQRSDQLNNNSDTDSDNDESFLDDPILNSIRQKRLAELKHQQSQHASNIAKGHGQYRTITQDEFLPECTSSEHVAVHFYQDTFQRCQLLDRHLRVIAEQYTACKFVRLQADKAPFFVTKLKVQTLPTLIVFYNGKVVDRMTGFDKIVVEGKDPDDWNTSQLLVWLGTVGAIDYTPPPPSKVLNTTCIYRGSLAGAYNDDDDSF